MGFSVDTSAERTTVSFLVQVVVFTSVCAVQLVILHFHQYHHHHCRLIEHGHSKADIAQAVRKVRKARHARDLSIHNKKWDHFHEVLEQTSRRFKKTLSLKRKTNLVTLAPTETTEATAVSSSVRPAMVRRMERKE